MSGRMRGPIVWVVAAAAFASALPSWAWHEFIVGWGPGHDRFGSWLVLGAVVAVAWAACLVAC